MRNPAETEETEVANAQRAYLAVIILKLTLWAEPGHLDEEEKQALEDHFQTLIYPEFYG